MKIETAHRWKWGIITASLVVSLGAFFATAGMMEASAGMFLLLMILPVSIYFGVGAGLALVLVSAILTTVYFSVFFPWVALWDSNMISDYLSLVLVAVLTGWISKLLQSKKIQFSLHDQLLGELTGIYEISKTLHRLDTENDAYAFMTERLAYLLGANMCAVVLYDEEKDWFYAQAPAFGLPDELIQTFQYPREQGKIVWDFAISDVFVANSFDEIPPYFLTFAEKFGAESVMLCRMQTESKLLGVVMAANRPGGFGKKEANLMKIFAGQVSLVVNSIRVFRSERIQKEELKVLHAIALAGTHATDESELLTYATEIIGRTFPSGNFGFLLLDEETQTLVPHQSYSLLLEAGDEEKTYPIGKGVTGQVALTKQPLRIADVSQFENYICWDVNTRSEICVPILIGEQVIGVINAESHQENAFSEDDERLLVTLAGQLSAAIGRLRSAKSNYYLATEMARANAILSTLSQVAARMGMATETAQVMQYMGEELKKLGIDSAIALVEAGFEQLQMMYMSVDMHILTELEQHMNEPAANTLFRVVEGLDNISAFSPAFFHKPLHGIKLLFSPEQAIQLDPLLERANFSKNTKVGIFPLKVQDKILGYLWLWGNMLRESDMQALGVFSGQVALAIENTSLLNRVQQMAITDELTGLHNRRHFFELAYVEFYRSRRYERSFGILMLDIDRFKRFNDQYGHPVGDVVLKAIAQQCKNSLRDVDIVGRYGGEEFIILLPESEVMQARIVAQRLCDDIARLKVDTPKGALSVTVSIGVAVDRNEKYNLLELVDLADQALYEAKQTGRNRVVIYQQVAELD